MNKQTLMKTKNFIGTGRMPDVLVGAAFCAVTLLAAGCSSDNEPATPENDTRVALQVSSGIDVQTRAHNDTWDKNDAIGIYMLNGTTTEVTNRKYTTTDGGTDGTFAPAGEQTIYFPVDGTQRDFIAYYPYRDLAQDNLYTVDVTPQTSQEAIDLMGAAKVEGKDKDDPAVAFVFTHKLVKLALTIQPDGTSLSESDLEGLTVTLTNQKTKATYDVVTGGAVAISDGDPATITLKTTAEGTSAEAIVLPNDDTKDMLLEFKLKDSGDTFRWAVKEAKKSQKFEAGSKYIYTVTLGRTAIEVTSTVTDWMPGNGSGETGNAQ